VLKYEQVLKIDVATALLKLMLMKDQDQFNKSLAKVIAKKQEKKK
jgi:hypothetical protein